MKRGKAGRRLSAAHSTIVAYVALAVALSGTAVAATGGNLILGGDNRASGPTAITTARGPALDLHTGDRAPFRVDSSARVVNLNADALDGLSSGDLQKKLTGSCSGGQFLTGVDAAGAVACGTPTDPLNGLTVSDLQKRVTGTCDPGNFVTGVDPSGAVTCTSPTLNMYAVWSDAADVTPDWGAATAYCHNHDIVTGGGYVLSPRHSTGAPQVTLAGPINDVSNGDLPADPTIGHNGYIVEADATTASGQTVQAVAFCVHLGPLN